MTTKISRVALLLLLLAGGLLAASPIPSDCTDACAPKESRAGLIASDPPEIIDLPVVCFDYARVEQIWYINSAGVLVIEVLVYDSCGALTWWWVNFF